MPHMRRSGSLPMFMGTYKNSIDAKNRMTVPSKQRERLGSACILTRGLDPCLYIYTLDDWKAQVARIEKLPESDPVVRRFVRHFFAGAAELTFDSHGRILLPPDLKEYAGIERDLVTIGAMRKIEVWARERWEEREVLETAAEDPFSKTLMEYDY